MNKIYRLYGSAAAVEHRTFEIAGVINPTEVESRENGADRKVFDPATGWFTSIFQKSAQKCECLRNNGRMGSFRTGCSAAALVEDECTSTCETPAVLEQILLPSNLCPDGMHACPISALSSDFECIDPAQDLANCGGCAETGAGVACGDYPGVKGAACVAGVCGVYSCQRGYSLDTRGTCAPVRGANPLKERHVQLSRSNGSRKNLVALWNAFLRWLNRIGTMAQTFQISRKAAG
ncbi:hypothetical protein C8J57DRAFT_1228805 [Mycena rebaudengoi]|nr:hypothetical protein C8J57DRAFT_1228805 [Mycena rebaudengoi]